jgi:hypothetical protein
MIETVAHSFRHNNRSFPISQAGKTYWENPIGYAKVFAMDDYRKNILRLIAGHPDADLKKASLAMNKNHAYLQQFITRGTPRHLKEIDRKKLALYLNVPESELMPPEHKEMENSLYGTTESAIIEKYRGLSESQKEEFVHFIDFLNSKNTPK